MSDTVSRKTGKCGKQIRKKKKKKPYIIHNKECRWNNIYHKFTSVITVGSDYGKQLRIKDLLIFSWIEY